MILLLLSLLKHLALLQKLSLWTSMLPLKVSVASLMITILDTNKAIIMSLRLTFRTTLNQTTTLLLNYITLITTKASIAQTPRLPWRSYMLKTMNRSKVQHLL